jgi:hypothetical protein
MNNQRGNPMTSKIRCECPVCMGSVFKKSSATLLTCLNCGHTSSMIGRKRAWKNKARWNSDIEAEIRKLDIRQKCLKMMLETADKKGLWLLRVAEMPCTRIIPEFMSPTEFRDLFQLEQGADVFPPIVQRDDWELWDPRERLTELVCEAEAALGRVREFEERMGLR